MDNSGHPIRIVACGERLVAMCQGRTIASTERALILFEASYAGVRYIPRQDVDLTQLVRSTHTTRCPFKGLASYYSVRTPSGGVENAVWTYEAPLPAAAAIAGYLAFDPRHVQVSGEPLP
jgi:uncharacterized protein (DUF427 family)